VPVVFEVMAHTGDSSLTQPGVPRGYRRTGTMKTQTMPVFLRFEPALTRTIPKAWLVFPSDTAAIALLRAHGVIVEPISKELSSAPIPLSAFMIDSILPESKPFQGHHEMHLRGKWRDGRIQMPGTMMMIRGNQPQAVAALYLLDPESDDGLVTWNVFDSQLMTGKPFPVWRVSASP
jgi:hypothetical protein